MIERQIIQKHHLLCSEGVLRECNRIQPVQECEQRRRLQGVLWPQHVSKTIRIERRNEPDEVVCELLPPVYVQQVSDVHLQKYTYIRRLRVSIF